MEEQPTSPIVHVVLGTAFSMEEIHTLCFTLGIDYDSFGGIGKRAKTFELVIWYERHNRLDDLIAAMRAARPGCL